MADDVSQECGFVVLCWLFTGRCGRRDLLYKRAASCPESHAIEGKLTLLSRNAQNRREHRRGTLLGQKILVSSQRVADRRKPTDDRRDEHRCLCWLSGNSNFE